MSQTSDQMELREEDIRKHYVAAAEMLMQLDHSPRLARARLSLETPEKSPDVAATRRRFRSTTPGLLARTTAPAGGVPAQLHPARWRSLSTSLRIVAGLDIKVKQLAGITSLR